MILLIDHYDSFVYNLARYFARLRQPTRVVRSDALSVAEVERLAPRAIVFSPGPCAPDQASVSVEIARALAGRTPMLGVCLGHQILAQAFGGRIVRSPQPMHGRTTPIRHDGRDLFQDAPCPLRVCRYHSLIVNRESLPTEWEVSAETKEGVIMGLRHTQHPLWGLQFHPEAILTACGYLLLANFLRQIGEHPPDLADELPDPPACQPYVPAPGGRPIPY